MDVVVVYETHFGQTGAIAAEIADGAHEAGANAVAVAVDHATREQVDGADLLVVGGPTHMRGMSRPWSRERLHAQELGSGGEIAAGVREWLKELPAESAGKRAAAFDTRLPSALAGGAARGVAHGLRDHGYSLAAEPEGFVVEEADGPLRDGERERARAWGAELARRAGGAGA